LRAETYRLSLQLYEQRNSENLRHIRAALYYLWHLLANYKDMERVLIPKLATEDLGTGKLGWYMDEIKIDPKDYHGDIRYPAFQSPCCNKRSAMTNHSIEPNGEVNASILCLCGTYHTYGIFEDWDSTLKKRAGSLTVEPA
jgi:hypothetical protein